jgi:propionyl-CoA carboxylase alpha chain
VATGAQVDPRYDPLLGKVIAHGETRAIAVARLEAALRGTALHGVATNRDYLLAVLASDDFRAGRTTTDFVQAHPDLRSAGPDRDAVRWHAAAAALALALRATGPLAFAPPAWRNVRSADARRTLLFSEPVEVGYRPERDGTWQVTVGDQRGLARAALLDDDGLDLELFGVRRRCRVRDDGDAVLVDSADHALTFEVVPELPSAAPEGLVGGQTAPLPGLVVSVEVKPGDSVAPGDTLVVLEAMKMEHRIRAGAPGTVAEVLVRAGQSVDAHEVLVVVE